MSKAKPITPYQRLKEQFEDYARSVKYARRKTMWFYNKDKLHEGWRLNDLHERVAAADQLGHDVKLEAREDGLYVIYVKRPDSIPWTLDV